MVSNPNNWTVRPDMLHIYNVLNQECQYTLNMKILDVCYLDYKSHYPFQRITRNISKLTLVGRLTALIDGKTDELLLDTKAKKNASNYIEHMGGINLSLANNDIITYGSLVHNLPNLANLVNEFIPFDTQPVTQYTDPEVSFELDMPKAYKQLLSVLAQCNTKKLSAVEKDKEVVVQDNKYFLINSGECTYYNTLLEFHYKNDFDIYKAITGENYKDDILYGSPIKDKVNVDNHLVARPINKKFEFTNMVFNEFPLETLREISEAKLFTTEIELDGNKLHVLDKNFFFPFKYYFQKIDEMLDPKTNPDKKVLIDNIRYRTEKLQSTFHVEFVFRVRYKEIELDIHQTFQAVILDKPEDEGDMLL